MLFAFNSNTVQLESQEYPALKPNPHQGQEWEGQEEDIKQILSPGIPSF